MQITPGHDFDTTDIPTRALLGKMASAMTLTGIELSQVSVDLKVLQVTNGSMTSLGEGSLWADARSNIWGKTRNGIVRVRVAEGGWESNRYPFRVHTGTSSIHRPGIAVDTLGLPAAGTNESNVALAVRQGAEVNRTLIGVLQETAVSAATTADGNFYRFVGRGGTRMYAPVGLPPALDRVILDYDTSSPTHWTVLNIETGAAALQRHAEMSIDDPDAQPADYGFGYFFNLVNLT